MNIENNTKKLDYPDSAEDLIGPYKHGVNTPNDIPSMLSVAASYQFLPMLKASVEYHFFDDKKAGMAGGKQKELERGTNEYLFGIEWDVVKRLTISGGAKLQIMVCLIISKAMLVSPVTLIRWALVLR